MSRIQRWLSNASHFVTSILGMTRLAWQAQYASFIGIILLTALQGMMPLAAAWVTKALFDLLAQGLQGNSTTAFPRDLLLLLAAQAVLSVVGQMTNPVLSYLDAELGRRLTVNIQSIIYREINGFIGIAYFETPRFHDTIRLATQSAQFGPREVLGLFTQLLRSAVTLFGFLGVLVSFNPLLAGLVGLAALPHLYSQLKIGRRRFELAFENSPKERRSFYYDFVLSGIPFAKELRLFGLADYFIEAFLQNTREIHQAQRQLQTRELRWQLALGIFSSLIASGAFVVVVIRAFSGLLSLGDVTLYVSAVSNVQNALSDMVFAFSRLNERVLFYTHFTNLLALPQPLPIADRIRPVPELKSGIELRHVSFRYSQDQAWVLHNVNLFIPAGKCVALVGLNGAGKTTLVKLLTRLYDPIGGQILWDGIDIREFDPQELRRRIGAILQDFVQYDLTAQENIGLGDICHIDDSARIRWAAIDAGIHDTIERLPKGYQTFLRHWLAGMEAGADLSAGEWQKVALARMFMRDADFLILDEPTASLDAQAEYEIFCRFVRLVTERTSLLISHRFSTVRMADIVAVLEDGQITEYGSHDDLLSLGRTYARLYTMQAEPYREGDGGRGKISEKSQMTAERGAP